MDFKVMLGGYKLIDFGGLNIAISKTIAGIYNKIKNTGKRIVGCNLKLGTTTFKELTLDVKENGTSYELTNTILKITVASDNSVIGEYNKDTVVYDDAGSFQGGIGDIGGKVICIVAEETSENWVDIGTVDEDGNLSLNTQSVTSLSDFTDGLFYLAINFKLRVATIYGGIEK